MWSGDGTSASNSYDMSEDFFDVLEKSGCLKDEKISSNNDFEIDSKAAEFSTFVPKIEKVLGEQSLLKNGTWAFLGNGNSDKASERYLFWTSFDTNKVGVGKKIPILIQRGDGKYYVSKSLTAERKKGNVTSVSYTHLFLALLLRENRRFFAFVSGLMMDVQEHLRKLARSLMLPESVSVRLRQRLFVSSVTQAAAAS